MTAARIELPKKLIPVFQGDADVRGSYGGRGSGKTRSFAKMAAVKGMIFGSMGLTGQILCARRFMNSLEDSSMEECKRAIEEEEWLSAYYEIGEKYIRSRDGKIWFSFAGLDRNIHSVKSKGRILLCWVDEAAGVSDYSLSILLPTLREEGDDWNAELWVTWNPERKTDAVERFRKSKDPRVKVVSLNWRDNPKFPALLERQRQRDLIERPDEYDHIWEGAYGSAQGSILGKHVNKAIREGRINEAVEFDRDGAAIEISGDIGFHDTASWWYWQRCRNGYRLLKYDGASGLDADDWIERIQQNLGEMGISTLGKIWLPHDARAKTFQSKYSSMERFLKAFGPEKIDIVPMSKKSDQINAARNIIDRCEFHVNACEDGIDGLAAWEYKYNEDTQAFSREPEHNWASHPSDAFAYGCQVMQLYDPPKPANDPMRAIIVGSNTVTLEELWKENRPQSKRL